MSPGWSENPFLAYDLKWLRIGDAAFYARLAAERDVCGRANHAPNLPPGALAGDECPRCTKLGSVLAMEAVATLRERLSRERSLRLPPPEDEAPCAPPGAGGEGRGSRGAFWTEGPR